MFAYSFVFLPLVITRTHIRVLNNYCGKIYRVTRVFYRKTTSIPAIKQIKLWWDLGKSLTSQPKEILMVIKIVDCGKWICHEKSKKINLGCWKIFKISLYRDSYDYKASDRGKWICYENLKERKLWFDLWKIKILNWGPNSKCHFFREILNVSLNFLPSCCH